MASTQQLAEQAQRSSLNLELPTNLTSAANWLRASGALRDSMFCGKRKLRIIVPSFRKDHQGRSRIANDAFSPKIAWPKLASITDHACPRRFWRSGNLQCDFLAQRPICRRLLAETSKLGGRRCLRVHGDQLGSLPVDSLGRSADVPGRHCVPNPDEVHWGQSLWSAQLASSGTN